MDLYHLMRPILTWAFTFYFKKINYAGGENIPKNKPVILSVNHPTGFFEPMLLGCIFPEHNFYFITRGDFFRKPRKRWILMNAHLLPIYRFRDGFSEMKKNAETMENINKMLSENAQVMIFSEGTTETVRFLRPLQKGFARLAFDNYTTYGDLDLQIVPIGMSYSEPHLARTEVYAKIGTPISLSNYCDAYKQSVPRAVQQLTKDTENAMRALIIQIDYKARESVADKYFKLYTNTYPEPTYPVYKKSARRLEAQQEIAHNINALSEPAFSVLTQRIDSYEQKLKMLNLRDTDIAAPPRIGLGILLTLIIGFIPYLLGKYLHIIPLTAAAWFRDKKVKLQAFKGPVYAAMVFAVAMVQYILLIVLAFIIGKASFWSVIVAMPFLATIAVNYAQRLEQFFGYFRLRKVDATVKENLSEERKDLMKSVFR